MLTEAERMQQLAGLVERSIGKAADDIKVIIDIDKTVHAGDQQGRHGDSNPITNDEIGVATKKAIPFLSRLLMFDKIGIGDDVVIQTRDGLNVVGNIQQSGKELRLVVITVMKKKGFKPKPGTYHIKVS